MSILHNIITNKIKNGIFFEAGANNGIIESNTYFLENLGWNGILIEPNIIKYRECCNNRKAKIINCAIVGPNYKNNTVCGNFSRNSIDSLMCSIFDIPDYFEEDQKNDILSKKEESNIEVDCYTIQTILENNSLEKIDFLSLDLEGYELEALKGLDLDKINPYFILIETANRPRYQKMVIDYLNEYKYKYCEKISGNDDLFIYIG